MSPSTQRNLLKSLSPSFVIKSSSEFLSRSSHFTRWSSEACRTWENSRHFIGCYSKSEFASWSRSSAFITATDWCIARESTSTFTSNTICGKVQLQWQQFTLIQLVSWLLIARKTRSTLTFFCSNRTPFLQHFAAVLGSVYLPLTHCDRLAMVYNGSTLDFKCTFGLPLSFFPVARSSRFSSLEVSWRSKRSKSKLRKFLILTPFQVQL